MVLSVLDPTDYLVSAATIEEVSCFIDTLCFVLRSTGNIVGNQTADVAVDQYHRYRVLLTNEM